jgi:hypothetical protein
MKLTLLDPTLTTKREQSANVESAMHDLNVLMLTSKNWAFTRRHAAIMEYIRMFQNTIGSLILKGDWQAVLSSEVTARFTELAKEITDVEVKPVPALEIVKPVPSNEFSSDLSWLVP